MTGIVPLLLGLTHKLLERIIETGSGRHRLTDVVWLLLSLNQPPLPIWLSIQPSLFLSVKQGELLRAYPETLAERNVMKAKAR